MPVLETLRARRWQPVELHLSDHLPTGEVAAATRLADELNVPVSIEPPDAIARLIRTAEHQGYLAKMPPFPYDDSEALLGHRPDTPFYVLIDGIQDPFNFGAILRSADALGVDAVFIGTSNQVDVTGLVVRASAGAASHVRLAKVNDLGEWIGRLKDVGVSIVGTSPHAQRHL